MLRSDHHLQCAHVSFDGWHGLFNDMEKAWHCVPQCIEPWCSRPNPWLSAATLFKSGIIHIPAGDRVQKTHVITLR